MHTSAAQLDTTPYSTCSFPPAFYCRKAILLLLLSRFSRVRLCANPQMAAHQAPRPWDSPGKNTGVGCHFLLQCMKVESESEVAQPCPTLSDPLDCSLPGSSVHGIFQARVGCHCLLRNTCPAVRNIKTKTGSPSKSGIKQTL